MVMVVVEKGKVIGWVQRTYLSVWSPPSRRTSGVCQAECSSLFCRLLQARHKQREGSWGLHGEGEGWKGPGLRLWPRTIQA